MPSIRLSPPSGRYLSFTEREETALLGAQDAGTREIAPQAGAITVDDPSRAAA